MASTDPVHSDILAFSINKTDDNLDYYYGSAVNGYLNILDDSPELTEVSGDSSNEHNGWNASVYLNTIGIPVVIIVGIIGNIISLVVFLFTRMRSQTCSIYLAHLNIADTGLLLCLVPAWLGWFHIDVFNRNGWCQLTVYATFVFSFLSTWTVVAFTVERYIVVYHPLRKPSMCTRKRAFTVLIGLDISACIMYGFSLWMTGLTTDHGLPSCTPLPEYTEALKVLSLIDTAITLIIPSLSIIILNTAILTRIYLFSKQMKISLSDREISNRDSDEDDEHQYLGRSCSNNSNSPKNKERLTTISKRLQESSSRRRRLYRMKTTRSLVLVSSSFLLLNMPSHIFRLYLFFSSIYEAAPKFSGNVVILHEIAMFIYYINFACNVFLYVLFSQSFRYGFLSLIKAARNKLRQQSCHPCFHQCRQKIQSIQCVQLCMLAPENIELNAMERCQHDDKCTSDEPNKLLRPQTV